MSHRMEHYTHGGRDRDYTSRHGIKSIRRRLCDGAHTGTVCIVKYKVQGMGMVCLILAHKARSLYFKVMFKCQAK